MTNSNIILFSSAAQGSTLGRLLIPQRLTEARQAARLTQTELAGRVGVSRQAVSAYELGTKAPEPSTMRKLANALGQPVAFLPKENVSLSENIALIFFRKAGADTKRRNQACEVLADWFSSAAFAFNEIANFPKVDLPQFEPKDPTSSAYSEEEIEDIAEATRQYFGLGLGPISNVLRLLESKGIITCRFQMTGEKVEAFSYWSGERPFIFLASDKESAARARFDAAHELGHLCLHRWVGREEIEHKTRLKEIETEADRFAGAFLLPKKSFPNEVYSHRAEAFVDLKARWKVSIQAMVYRCKDLGLFDERQLINIYKQISYKKWRTSEPLDKGIHALPMEEPMLLQRIAQLVFENGRYGIDEFKADVALSDETLEQLIGVSFTTNDSPDPTDFDSIIK